MRKVICVVSFLALAAILLSACTETKSNNTATETMAASSGQVTDAPKPETDYTSIECRDNSRLLKTYFAPQDSNLLLDLWLPSEWTLKEKAGGYQILRDKAVIGRIYSGGAPAEYENNCLEHQTENTDGITVDTYVLKTADSASGYTRCFSYAYTDGNEKRRMTLETDYAEISDFTFQKLASACECKDAVSDSHKGELKAYRSNGRDSVLILGNSFINSSQIGSILRSMIERGGKSTSVEAVSRGYATVQSYVESGDYLTRIQNREYGIVFMCGFYGSGAVDSLESIVNVCKSSGTMLVIFPAHNESSSVITSACNKWKNDAYFLDWKGEISDLIKYTDATDTDMCIQDQHKHSTALAGFVGAHMIYRAIYDEIPPSITNSAITTQSAREKLGRYVDIGGITKMEESMIHRLA
ncbi:MAG: hypothetical protein ACI3XQ_10385 [Eubacteriales bacterium]